LYYRAIVLKTAWYWHKNRQIDQWNRIEDPDINPRTYDHLIFDKGAKSIQWKKNSIFNKWCWHNWIRTCRRLQIDPYLSPCTKLKCKYIKDLTINPSTELQATDPETRQSIIYTIAYENANPICKRILLPLKIRSAPLEEWVLCATNINYNVQNTGAWVGEAISKGLKWQQEIKMSRGEDVRAWQGEAPYRGQCRYQEAGGYYYYEPEPWVGRAFPWRK
ncbi:hypothetical protein ACQP3C_24505, partial [Escherichia coli]